MANDLRDFLVYFEGEDNSTTLTAVSFKADHWQQKRRIQFFIDDEKKGCVYVKPDSVMAIIPADSDEGYTGQVFRITLKGGTHIDIRAAWFRLAMDSLWFYDAEDKFLSDVYVSDSEVLACVPIGTVPPKPPPLGVK